MTLTGSFKRLLVERYGVEPWKVAVVPPGVDLGRFTPGDSGEARELLGLPVDGQVVVSVRRLVARMGLETLLEAWAGLGPTEKRTLLVVGDGPERGRLEELAAGLGVADSVGFLGRLGEEELVACYRAADVSVVPTTELEGFGLIVLESLACGTPVITTDVGGLPEATSGLKGRIVTPADDPEHLTDALDGVLGGGLAPASPSECRAHAQRFSPESLGKRHRDIYRRAIAPPPRRRRVVYVNDCARLAGAEICLHHMLRALDQIDAHVILGEEGPLEVRLREEGISTEVLPLGAAAGELRRDRVRPGIDAVAGAVAAASCAARLARRLRRIDPDLVHVNTLRGGMYGAPAARLARLPLVWHLHTRLATDYMPSPAVRLVRTMIDRFADQVVVNSRSTLETLGRGSLDRASEIPCPIEVPDSQVEIRDEVKRVGMVGRLAPWKGQDVFIDAVARAFPSHQVEAVVIGVPMFGEDEFADGLRSRAEQLGAAVDFRGFRDDVPAELARLDLLVHASTIPEPFGQVVLEGMAAGLPVVAADAGGPAEIITNGVDGLLYPPGDASALAAHMERLADDRDLRLQIGLAGRERASDFSPELVAERMLHVYSRAMERKPFGRRR